MVMDLVTLIYETMISAGAYLEFVEFKIGIPAAAAFIAFKGRAIICTQIRRTTVRILFDPINTVRILIQQLLIA